MFIAKQNGHIACIGETEQEVINIMASALATDYVIEETDIEYELYDNEYLTKEEIAQKERERLDHLSLTKREVFLAIYKDKQITPEQIRSMLTSEEAKIEFDYANDYYRGNPLIGALGEALGYTPSQLDVLFETGEIPPDVNEVVDETTAD